MREYPVTGHAEPHSVKMRGSIYRTAALCALMCSVIAMAFGLEGFWMPHHDDGGQAGTTVSSYEEMRREDIQATLDRQVRDSMMTVAVSPVLTLHENGEVELVVANDRTNTLPQQCTIQQNGVQVYSSGHIQPGQSLTSCKAEGIAEGKAIVTVQGINPETSKPQGSPASVEVEVRKNTNALGQNA